jgi:hypothetical protein
MVVGSVSRSKLPSVDPEVEQAASDMIENPDAYFYRERELRRQEAKEYVADSIQHRRRNRPGIRAFLSALVSR